MDNKLNKPRVFLSHSKKDNEFINNINNDFRKCHIEPWMDTEEIRDGKSWLKVIFEDGIPTCDVIIVYFTDNSIKSKMVGKEIVAALIEQLSDQGIAFLPYVENEELRAKLRTDIRSLHIRVWNDKNYTDILPSVVAEIWHSYLERTVQAATLRERNKKMELELELSRLKDKNQHRIFSPSEDADFVNIYRQLDKQVEIYFDLWEKKDGDKGTVNKIGKDAFRFNLFEIIAYHAKEGYYYLNYWHLLSKIKRFLKNHGYPEDKRNMVRHYGNSDIDKDYFVALKSYGLIKRIQEIDRFGITNYQEKLTDKFYRFLYWLEYNNHMREEISFEYIGRIS